MAEYEQIENLGEDLPNAPKSFAKTQIDSSARRVQSNVSLLRPPTPIELPEPISAAPPAVAVAPPPDAENQYEVPHFSPVPDAPPANPAQTKPVVWKTLRMTRLNRLGKRKKFENETNPNVPSTSFQQTPVVASDTGDGTTTATPTKQSDGEIVKSEDGIEKETKKKSNPNRRCVKSYTRGQCACIWLWTLTLLLSGSFLTGGFLFLVFGSYFRLPKHHK